MVRRDAPLPRADKSGFCCTVVAHGADLCMPRRNLCMSALRECMLWSGLLRDVAAADKSGDSAASWHPGGKWVDPARIWGDPEASNYDPARSWVDLQASY